LGENIGDRQMNSNSLPYFGANFHKNNKEALSWAQGFLDAMITKYGGIKRFLRRRGTVCCNVRYV
jgi:hypothetical protein